MQGSLSQKGNCQNLLFRCRRPSILDFGNLSPRSKPTNARTRTVTAKPSYVTNNSSCCISFKSPKHVSLVVHSDLYTSKWNQKKGLGEKQHFLTITSHSHNATPRRPKSKRQKSRCKRISSKWNFLHQLSFAHARLKSQVVHRSGNKKVEITIILYYIILLMFWHCRRAFLAWLLFCAPFPCMHVCMWVLIRDSQAIRTSVSLVSWCFLNIEWRKKTRIRTPKLGL